jgi:hypothetical protein
MATPPYALGCRTERLPKSHFINATLFKFVKKLARTDVSVKYFIRLINTGWIVGSTPETTTSQISLSAKIESKALTAFFAATVENLVYSFVEGQQAPR